MVLVNTKLGSGEVEDFLYLEGELLDRWELDQWLALYTKDARYLVPTPDVDPNASPYEVLFYIADDWNRMEARVHRLSKATAHIEHPHSQTRHFLSNIRVNADDPDQIRTSASFIVYRHQLGTVQSYIGRVSHILVNTDDGLRIREKRCELDGMRLDQGKISIIL